MLPEAKQKALLYATSIGYIYVFEYPVGKFLGKIYDEGSPLRLALAFEQATEWHKKTPTLIG